MIQQEKREGHHQKQGKISKFQREFQSQNCGSEQKRMAFLDYNKTQLKIIENYKFMQNSLYILTQNLTGISANKIEYRLHFYHRTGRN